MNKHEFTISRNKVCAMRYLCSTDESRYALTGVRFEAKNGTLLLIAADDRKLGVLNCGKIDTGDFGFTCAFPLIKPLAFRKDERLNITYEGGESLRCKMPGGTVEQECITGAYPPWKQCVPKTPAAKGEWHFDHGMLDDFARVGQILKGSGQMRLLQHEPDEKGNQVSFSVFLVQCPEFYGVLMPLKSVPLAIPDWL